MQSERTSGVTEMIYRSTAFLLALLIPIAGHAQTTNGVVIASSAMQNIAKVLPLNSGYLPIGQGPLADPIAQPFSGDCTLTGGGVVTCLKTNGVLFGSSATVATGTSGATIPVLNASNTHSGSLNTFTGHVAAGSSSPVLTACGTSPTILGDDKDGQVTMGTASPTGCVITFASAYTGNPALCTVTWQANLASQSYAVTNTAITLTQTATSSNKVNYHCAAQNGG
jgi:hypothetical protein